MAKGFQATSGKEVKAGKKGVPSWPGSFTAAEYGESPKKTGKVKAALDWVRSFGKK